MCSCSRTRSTTTPFSTGLSTLTSRPCSGTVPSRSSARASRSRARVGASASSRVRPSWSGPAASCTRRSTSARPRPSSTRWQRYTRTASKISSRRTAPSSTRSAPSSAPYSTRPDSKSIAPTQATSWWQRCRPRSAPAPALTTTSSLPSGSPWRWASLRSRSRRSTRSRRRTLREFSYASHSARTTPPLASLRSASPASPRMMGRTRPQTQPKQPAPVGREDAFRAIVVRSGSFACNRTNSHCARSSGRSLPRSLIVYAHDVPTWSSSAQRTQLQLACPNRPLSCILDREKTTESTKRFLQARRSLWGATQARCHHHHSSPRGDAHLESELLDALFHVACVASALVYFRVLFGPGCLLHAKMREISCFVGCRLVPSGYMAQNSEIHRIEAPRGAQ
mmetsp:Transcript_5951/g.10067  ORF Transcript_5951/g.10067 Transcript_5951/m.10067 type:complete len:395 (-) Transcript_5951:209-1393(-)